MGQSVTVVYRAQGLEGKKAVRPDQEVLVVRIANVSQMVWTGAMLHIVMRNGCLSAETNENMKNLSTVERRAALALAMHIFASGSKCDSTK